ncbi:MAG: M48 family metalloprotease [Pseudomonadota bacterium]
MIKLTPILLALAYGVGMYLFSAWRLKAELSQNSKPLDDPILVQLTQQMADSIDLPQIKVHVYDVDPVNGLASPDGRIFITKGFLKKYRQGEVTAPELAGVIAHELGHVALGHARRRMIDFSVQNAMRVGVAMVLNRFLPGIGVYIANVLSSLFVAGLSRKDEYEADAYAAALMTKAGLGTAPQKTLFRKLDRVIGQRGGQFAWMMSHPKTEDRVRAIEALETKWGTAVTKAP